jgi:hypothetical protein
MAKAVNDLVNASLNKTDEIAAEEPYTATNVVLLGVFLGTPLSTSPARGLPENARNLRRLHRYRQMKRTKNAQRHRQFNTEA